MTTSESAPSTANESAKLPQGPRSPKPDSSPVPHGAQPKPARHRQLGWWIRAALLLSWIGIYGHYASGHVLLSLGLIERQDSGSIILSHLDRRYRYAFINSQNNEIGQLFLEYDFIDASYEVSLRVNFDSVDAVPGFSLIKQQFGSVFTSDRIDITVINRLDDRFQMRELEANGVILGIDGSFAGTITAQGMLGTITIPSFDFTRTQTFDAFSQQASAGFDMMIALPPELEVGDRFQDQVIAIDWKPPFVKRQTVVYSVEEAVIDDDGTTLHRMTITQDGRAMGELLADQQGVIRQTKHPATNMTLQLTTIFDKGERVWSIDDVGMGTDQAVLPPPDTTND